MRLPVLFISAALMLGTTSCCNSSLFDDISTLTDGQTYTCCDWGRVELQPGEEKVLCSSEGAGALKYFYLTDGPEYITDEALVLRIYWDGKEYPSVNVPAADFFGSIAGRPVDWSSKYLSVHHNSHQCFFPMPFSKGFKVVIANDGDHPYIHDVAYNFDYVLDRAYKHNKSRFHAYYNRSNPTGGLHTILDVKGHGQYVGNILSVFSKSWRWWGEGDTDFLIDGVENKHTPGTEDEYGSCFDLGLGFNHYTYGYIEGGNADPQARWGVNYHGHNRMYRYYDSNPVRFRKGLKVTIQNQYCAPGTEYDFKGQQKAGDDYTSVAYYYLKGAFESYLMPYADRVAETNAMDY